MVVKPSAKKTRGTPIDLPDWWLRAASRYTVDVSLSELASVLSERAGRSPAWRRETVGDFLKNDHATWELMEAFSDHFDIPRAGYIARSYEEADEHRKAARRFAAAPELTVRRVQLDKGLEALTKKLEDQTRKLDSGADVQRSKVRRRPRGVGRRGPSST